MVIESVMPTMVVSRTQGAINVPRSFLYYRRIRKSGIRKIQAQGTVKQDVASCFLSTVMQIMEVVCL
jgi:hypothetical protein